MNIITFRLHTQFNSIFPVVKIISEWLLLRAIFSLARGGLLAVSVRGRAGELPVRGEKGENEEENEEGNKKRTTEVI